MFITLFNKKASLFIYVEKENNGSRKKFAKITKLSTISIALYTQKVSLFNITFACACHKLKYWKKNTKQNYSLKKFANIIMNNAIAIALFIVLFTVRERVLEWDEGFFFLFKRVINTKLTLNLQNITKLSLQFNTIYSTIYNQSASFLYLSLFFYIFLFKLN